MAREEINERAWREVPSVEKSEMWLEGREDGLGLEDRTAFPLLIDKAKKATREGGKVKGDRLFLVALSTREYGGLIC